MRPWFVWVSWVCFLFFLIGEGEVFGETQTAKYKLNPLAKHEPSSLDTDELNPLGKEELRSLKVQEGDQLFIRGFSGKLRLIGKPQGRAVSLKAIQVNPKGLSLDSWKGWALLFRRAGRRVEIVVKGPSSKLVWDVASRRPRFEIFVEAPPMLAEIHWQEGTVSVQGWKSDLVASMGRGQVDDSKGKGSHRISLQNGSLKVSSHEGELDLESYKGRVSVVESQSRVRFENFAGVSEFKKVSGHIYFTSYKGETKFVQCEGEIEFNNIQSPVKIEKFKGVVRGQSKQGSVRVSSVGQANIHLITEEGAVYLNLLRSSARVDLGSIEGGIYAPKFLNLTRLPNLKLIRGRLKGGVKGGKVTVRTRSGKIFLK